MSANVNLAVYLVMLHDEQPHMNFDQAMRLARRMMDHHITVQRDAEDKGYAEGHKNGYASGKADAEQPTSWELTRLRDIEKRVKAQGEELVKDIVREVGSHKKIQCIKQLREKTGLGLKDSKDIVDAYVAKLNGMYLADWERALLDAAY
jgi:ribosomal protein L7/L12